MADIAEEKLAEFVKSWNVVVLEVVDYKSVPVGNMSGKKADPIWRKHISTRCQNSSKLGIETWKKWLSLILLTDL